ncbi:MAG: replication initiation protein [Oscillospiraceae bacterium]|nr:replication initiation protein [Oscillospiraceae bacterium]
MSKRVKGTELVEKRNVLNELRKNNMTLQELRVFSIYLAKINARDISTRKVRFSIGEFQRILELDRPKIDYFKEVTANLLQKLVEVPEENGGYNQFQLFKRCRMSKDECGEWYVELDAHDEALPLMFDFKSHYFTYELWNVLTLTSRNQIRLYEILKQYQFIGKRKISLEELRRFLGIEPDEYPRWCDFKRRVLDSCQQALAEQTDITFNYEPIRTGHKFTAVIFFIRKNENYVDHLKLDDYIQRKKPIEVLPESKLSEEWTPLDKDTDDEIAEEIYGDKNLAFLAGACDYEFSPQETRVLFDYLLAIGLVGRDNEVERYKLLRQAYNKLNAMPNIPKRDSAKDNVHNRRFGLIKWLFENKYNFRI